MYKKLKEFFIEKSYWDVYNRAYITIVIGKGRVNSIEYRSGTGLLLPNLRTSLRRVDEANLLPRIYKRQSFTFTRPKDL